MSKTVNMKQRGNGYLEVIFHALDVFSIIFATVYVEVKISARMDVILSASAIYMY